MDHRRSTRNAESAILTIGMLLGAFAGGRPAQADVFAAQWFGSDDFYYSVHHMPDFDQRRHGTKDVIGLLNDGAMYCVPTGSTNMLVYVANHGFPGVQPGPETFLVGNPAHYEDITWFLGGDIGGVMGTDPNNGTGGQGFYDGVRAYLPESQFTVTAHFGSPTGGFPRFEDMAKNAIQGSLIVPGYGRWSQVGSMSGVPILQRTGGHVVTLTKASAALFTGKEMYFRDPADDPANTTQSNFTERKFKVQNESAIIDGHLVSLPNLLLPGESSSNRYLDGYIAVRPKEGYSFTPGGPIIDRKIPFHLYGGLLGTSSQLTIDDGVFKDISTNPDLTGFAAITEPADGTDLMVQVVDMVDGSTVDLGGFPGARTIVTGPNGEIYLLTDTEIICLDPDIPTDPVEARVGLPSPFDDIAYDDPGDNIVVISQQERLIQKYQAGLPLGVKPVDFVVPVGVPLSGRVSIGLRPELGDASPCFWVISEASSSLFGIFITDTLRTNAGLAFVEISMPEITDPTCISFDDAGDMFVVDGGRVKQLTTDALGETWSMVPVEESDFGQFEVGQCFYPSRSRIAFDPRFNDTPGWNTNIPPEELSFGDAIADCPGDTNEDGFVNIDDLLNLLAAWGDCDHCIADTDGNRTIDIFDLLEQLATWGACP